MTGRPNEENLLDNRCTLLLYYYDIVGKLLSGREREIEGEQSRHRRAVGALRGSEDKSGCIACLFQLSFISS